MRDEWVNKGMNGYAFATPTLRVRIQTSLKNHKMAKQAKEWLTHSSPPKINTKGKKRFVLILRIN
jgi:hypothetical protein